MNLVNRSRLAIPVPLEVSCRVEKLYRIKGSLYFSSPALLIRDGAPPSYRPDQMSPVWHFARFDLDELPQLNEFNIMTTIDENLAPEIIPGVNPRSLKVDPTPEDYFILSRVNGSMTVSQICSTSGLGREKTLECIGRLKEVGLIRFPGDPLQESASKSKEKNSPKSGRPSSSDADELGQVIRARFPVHFDDFEFDQELLAQQIEMEDSLKKEVLFVYSQLNDVNFYELLGTTQTATRRELRRGYFALSKRYHPDLFFRKMTGDFGPMIEKIFQRITKAYQTLSNRNKRSAYDATLGGGRTPVATPIQASTPASRRSEPIEVIGSNRKREMAFKVLTNRGEEAFGKGRIAAALREFRKALSLKRDFDLAIDIAGRLAELDDHLDDAIAFARAAEKIKPTAADVYLLLGKIYEAKGEFEDAVYHYDKGRKLSPEQPEPDTHKARVSKPHE